MNLSNVEFAVFVRKRRLGRCWTQQHLADAARVHLRTVQRVERGEGCSKETVLALLGAFDVDAEITVNNSRGLVPWPKWTAGMKESLKKLVIYGGMAYLAVYVALVLFIAVKFGGLYEVERPPDLNVFQETFAPYLKWIHLSAVCLGIWMAIWSSGVGVLYRAFWKGLAALAIAGGVTLIGFSLLPWVLYPADQYSPAVLFLMTGVVPIAVCWVLVTVAWTRVKPIA